MNDFRRPLEGHVANISVSESNDSEHLGFPNWQVNRVTLQLAAALFGQGATVIFGHDWRDDGVMQAIYGFARQVQPPIVSLSEHSDSSIKARLMNFLPWPDDPYLAKSDLDRLKDTLFVQSVGLPLDLQAYEQSAKEMGEGAPLHRYLRARALTHLRHCLTRWSGSRICIGGRRAGSAGRYPGVIEEGLLALRANKPLYIAGMLGGASRQIIEALKGRPMPEDFCAATDVSLLYKDPPIVGAKVARTDDDAIDRQRVWAEFAAAGINRVSEVNKLSPDENNRLFETSSIDQVIELMLIGLSRLQNGS